jgi:hypothetical protein
MAANLLDNASATGDAMQVAGGTYVVSADGTFGGATLQLQLRSPDGTSWLTIADAVLTAEGSYVIDLGDGEIRMAVTGGTPSALYASIGATS